MFSGSSRSGSRGARSSPDLRSPPAPAPIETAPRSPRLEDPEAGPVDEAELEVDMQRDGEDERFAALQDRLLGELEVWVRAEVPRGPMWVHGDFVAATMLDWKASYGDGELARWTTGDLAEYLLDHFPRKVTVGDGELDQVVDCVLGFLAFLDWRGSLRGDLLVVLRRAGNALREPFLERARDPVGWGMAKSLAQQMLADGVDPEDEMSVERWMAAFNERPRAERDSVLGTLAAPAGAGRTSGGGGSTRRTRSDAERRDKRRAEKKARKRGRR